MARTLAILLALAAPLTASAAFPDVPQSSVFSSYIELLEGYGVVRGNPDGTYQIDRLVNRAEFLEALLRAVPGEAAAGGDVRCFADFQGAEQWYWRSACEAKARGIVKGYPDGSFGGSNPINEAEAMAMAVMAFRIPLLGTAPATPWYERYFAAADLIGVRDWVSFIEPGHAIHRGEMANLIGGIFLAMEEQQCLSADDCMNGRVCSVEELGECRSPCPPGDGACIQVCSGLCLPTIDENGRDELEPTCATYMRDGRQVRQCSTCGDDACGAYERCTASSCDGQSCTKDCGPLHCPSDCD